MKPDFAHDVVEKSHDAHTTVDVSVLQLGEHTWSEIFSVNIQRGEIQTFSINLALFFLISNVTIQFKTELLMSKKRGVPIK